MSLQYPQNIELKACPQFLQKLVLKQAELSNGEQLAYHEKHMQDNSKPVLILIHGVEGGAYNFNKLLDVAPDYFRIIAPDIRGHGLSSNNKEAYSCEEFAEDIKLLADYLAIKKASVFAWSFGAGIALKLAAMYPDFVQKLILQGPMPITGLQFFKSGINGKKSTEIFDELENWEDQFMVKNSLQRIQQQDRYYFKNYITRDFNNHPYEEETLELQLDLILLTQGLKGAFWAMNSFNMSSKNNGSFQGKNDIQDIKCKVLFLVGAHDKYIQENDILEYKKYLGDLLTIKYFEKCGHAIHPFYPKEICEEINNFINSNTHVFI